MWRSSLLSLAVAAAGCVGPGTPASVGGPQAAASTLASPSVADLSGFTNTLTMQACPARALIATPPTPGTIADLRRVDGYSRAHGGHALLVLHDGRIVYEAYKDGEDRRQLYNSYSMHKSVLALAVGAALDDEILGSLDDPVGVYIREWRDDARGRITLRQLLTMQSGLRLVPLGSGAAHEPSLTNSSYIDAVALAYPVSDPPGAVFAYNNVNSQIVGIALRRALARPGRRGARDYATYLRDRIWCPIGGGEARLWLDRPNGAPHAFAGLFATARDWARLGELIRLRGTSGRRRIISDGFFDILVAPAATNPNYALHIWRGDPWVTQRRYSAASPVFVPQSAPFRTNDWLFFDGFGGQRVYISPRRKLVIVRFGDVNLDYDDGIIPNLVDRAFH